MKRVWLCLVFVISALLLSISIVSADVAPNFASFNFPSSPYAQNGPGAKGPYCMGAGSMDPKCGSTGPWDIGSVFVTQDFNYLAWQFYAPNMSKAKFCDQTTNNFVNISIEFDADSNSTSGCTGACYPGSDYRIIFRGININGSAELHYYNSSSFSFILNSSVDVFINKTSCGQPTQLKLAINKTRISNLRGLMFQVEVKEPSIAMPLDVLGTFGGDNMNFNNSNFDPLSRPTGCGLYAHTNATACVNNTNGDSCKWDTDFNDCFPDFFGTGGSFGGSGMSCSQFCGICRNSTDCGTNQRCQWNANIPNPMTGSTGACIEDSSKVIIIPGAGSCDQDCHNCFTNYSCSTSAFPDPRGLGGAGCVWVNDSLFNRQWCEPSNFVLQNCSTSAPERCITNATCAINVANGTWDFTNNFCYIAGTEICFNGIDDDANGKIDCSDSACGNSAACGGGTDTLTGGAGTIDPMEAMKQRMMGGMVAPPTQIGDAPLNATQLTSNYSIIDINGFSVADMGNALGMGVGVRNMSPSALCSVTGGITPSIYYYLIDVDANSSTGCNANISRAVSAGYEYEIVYQINWNGTNYTEIKRAYRCIPSTGNFSLFPGRLVPPPDPPFATGPNYIQCNEANAAIIAIDKTDIGNPKSRMRFSIAASDSTTNLSAANDSLTDLYYKPGTIDFRPTDCFSNPTACGSRFSIIGGGKFMPFQDCLSSTDTDGNGYSGCGDPFCVNFPRCAGASDRYNSSNDKDAPSMISNRVETFPDFAFINWVTDEPSNGTVRFYNRTNTCTGSYTEKVDRPPFALDVYRPFHGMPMDRFVWGFTLSSNTTYFYKTYSCDAASNCGLSACLNFTTKGASESRVVQFKFEFTPPSNENGTLLGSTSMKFINSSGGEINITASSLQNLSSFITNATLKFENSNTSTPWSIELEGVDIAKTLNVNLTGSFNATNSTGSTYLGMSSSKWQEMAQNLGADSIKVTIPTGGNSLLKCDESNLSNCQDVTSQATLVSGGLGYGNTTWRIPTSLGFSVYGTTTGGVTVSSDKTTYKCYPSCTAYVNISNNNASVIGLFNLTINNTYTGSGITFNISYYNASNSSWVYTSTNNNTAITNYNFTNQTTHQFRIDITLNTPIGIRWLFNASISNETLNRSFTDISYLDAINLTTANNNVTTNQTPPLRFILYAFNDTSQNCTLHINGSDYSNTSVNNGSLTTIVATTTITNGTYAWNVSCTSNETSETGYSETRFIQISDTTAPVISSISSGTPTSSAATITWTTNEVANSSVNYGTSTALGTPANESSFKTSHSISLSSLSASTTYYYNVTSCDNIGNCVTNGSNSFSTSSAGTTTTGGGGGSGGSGLSTVAAKESFASFNIAASATATKTLTSTAIGFTSIAIAAKNAVSNADLSVEKLTAKPSAAETPAGKVYQYLQLTTTVKEADASSIKIKFRVEKSWLTSSGVNENDIVLMRLTDKWNELKTTKSSSDATYVNYEAESPGFSYYAIAQKAAAVTVAANVTPTAPTPTANITPTVPAPKAPEEKKPIITPVIKKGKELVSNKALLYSIVGIVIIVLVVLYFFIRKKGELGKAGKEKPLF